MQVTMLEDKLTAFYIYISKREPIFHAEALVTSLDDSSPIKRYIALLVSLAKAHVTASKYRVHDPPVNLPHELRQKFICLLNTLPYVLFYFYK